MNVRVIYHTMSGNTKKVADAIAEAANVKSETVSECKDIDNADLLFIGDGIYAGKPDAATVNFIKKLDSGCVKNAAVFTTYGRQDKTISILRDLLKKQGVNVFDDSFGCKGKCWGFINRKHPTSDELNAAKEFAKRIMNKVNI